MSETGSIGNTTAIAALADPLRRRLFELVRNAGHPLSRDEAAEGAGISRSLAAFHLDKLVDRGLLTFAYARPEGRSGPGAGRPSKVYEPSDVEIEVSIPERNYDVIGKLLVDSIMAEPGQAARAEVASNVAAAEGRRIGERIRAELRMRPPGTERALATATDILRDRGYEPYPAEDGSLRLRSCPFHAIARHAPELVCRMNRAFIEGLVRGIGNQSLEAALEPTPGECCVVLRPRRQEGPSTVGRPDPSFSRPGRTSTKQGG
jgi:predicted ArsR family transcriptional regulator